MMENRSNIAIIFVFYGGRHFPDRFGYRRPGPASVQVTFLRIYLKEV